MEQDILFALSLQRLNNRSDSLFWAGIKKVKKSSFRKVENAQLWRKAAENLS